jgi:hypothetical protein
MMWMTPAACVDHMTRPMCVRNSLFFIHQWPAQQVTGAGGRAALFFSDMPPISSWGGCLSSPVVHHHNKNNTHLGSEIRRPPNLTQGIYIQLEMEIPDPLRLLSPMRGSFGPILKYMSICRTHLNCGSTQIWSWLFFNCICLMTRGYPGIGVTHQVHFISVKYNNHNQELRKIIIMDMAVIYGKQPHLETSQTGSRQLQDSDKYYLSSR